MSDAKRIAIVTGASQGIGKAIYCLFAERGITTIGVSRHIALSDTTRRCDLRSEAAVQELCAELVGTFGHIDILVNNAGTVTHGDILETSLDDWENVIQTNLTGTFLCCKHVLGHMKERHYGKIVNISSIAGRFRSSMASVAYTCSKYGVVGLTRQLALHYARHNININCVCPSQTRTPMLVEKVSQERINQLVSTIPAGRLAEPDDIARAVYFLATDEASYINGAVIDVNGGQF
jgi:3-oxoacyl-[acyl-carrier protein] reductase